MPTSMRQTPHRNMHVVYKAVAYVVAVRFTVTAGCERRVLDAVRAIVPLARAEEGCLVYQAARDPDDPRVLFFYEIYVDEAAFDAHRASAHFQRYVVDGILPLLDDRERAIYETVAD